MGFGVLGEDHIITIEARKESLNSPPQVRDHICARSALLRTAADSSATASHRCTRTRRSHSTDCRTAKGTDGTAD